MRQAPLAYMSDFSQRRVYGPPVSRQCSTEHATTALTAVLKESFEASVAIRVHAGSLLSLSCHAAETALVGRLGI